MWGLEGAPVGKCWGCLRLNGRVRLFGSKVRRVDEPGLADAVYAFPASAQPHAPTQMYGFGDDPKHTCGCRTGPLSQLGLGPGVFLVCQSAGWAPRY